MRQPPRQSNSSDEEPEKLKSIDPKDLDVFFPSIMTAIFMVAMASIYKKLPHVAIISTLSVSWVWWFFGRQKPKRRFWIDLFPFWVFMGIWVAMGDTSHHVFKVNGEVLIRDIFLVSIAGFSMFPNIVVRHKMIMPLVWVSGMTAGFGFPTEDSTPSLMQIEMLSVKVLLFLLLFISFELRTKTGVKVVRDKATTLEFDAKWGLGQSSWVMFVYWPLCILAIPQCFYNSWVFWHNNKNIRSDKDEAGQSSLPVQVQTPTPMSAHSGPYSGDFDSSPMGYSLSPSHFPYTPATPSDNVQFREVPLTASPYPRSIDQEGSRPRSFQLTYADNSPSIEHGQFERRTMPSALDLLNIGDSQPEYVEYTDEGGGRFMPQQEEFFLVDRTGLDD